VFPVSDADEEQQDAEALAKEQEKWTDLGLNTVH